MVTKTLLIEIGTEELPPKALNKLRLALQINVETEIDQVELSYRKIESFASPRRLAILVHDLKDQQPTQGIEKKGPSKASAFDNGEPTKALKGFMKGCNVNDPSQLDLVETKKGSYIVYRTNEPGLYLESLLEELLKNALAALPIAKRMRWGKTRAEFVRPVQWLVCLYGDTIIPINLFGKKSGNTSRGHRFMSDGNFQIKNAGDYSGQCRENFVLVNFEERKEKIRDQIQAIANKENLYLGLDEELLDEVTSLVEWPKAVIGDFDKEFLKVPSKVLISAMKEHQRYFHLVDSDDRLVSKFITISNIESRDYSEVIKGNERVIKARLSDAAFFFDQDTRTRLDEKSNKLDSVIFQAELGNYAEKCDRISALSAYIAARVEEDVEAAIRAGRLCKADLVTDMVSEFSDLQGIMGGYYARHDGENEEVCVAIEEHYRPTQSGGELPSTRLGSCLAIADKVDSLVGIFGIKQAPTGSKDPFALRRQSLGVIRVCIEHGLDFSLDDILVESSRLYGKHFKVDEVCTYIVGSW